MSAGVFLYVLFKDQTLLPDRLSVLEEFVLIVGIGIYALVERLLIEQLGFEKV